jgi:hypothetical protein
VPIVSSTSIIDAHTQQGGGRYVIERHTDDAGQVYQVGPWLAPEGFDVAARVASRAAQINDQLAEAEAQALIADGA